MIFIVVKMKVKPEFRDRWMTQVEQFTKATRAEPGNIFFEWAVSVDDPDEFVLMESFQDDAAEAHVSSDHFRDAISWMPDFLASTPKIINCQGVSGNGWGAMAELEPR